MAHYTDFQQRQLDIATSAQMDRRPMPPCRCSVCGAPGHIWCNRVLDSADGSETQQAQAQAHARPSPRPGAALVPVGSRAEAATGRHRGG